MAAVGPALVVGSLGTAQDGRYQSLITDLAQSDELKSLGSSAVERQILDRILDAGTVLSPKYYSSAHVLLTEADYSAAAAQLHFLATTLAKAIVPNGKLHFSNPPQAFESDVRAAGLQVVSQTDGTLVAQAPAAPAAPAAVKLPKRDKAAKAALWSLNAPSTNIIDPDSLLTAADKAKPVPTCEPVNPDAPRRKRACKGCTCGLAEIEAAEAVVMLDGMVDGNARAVSGDEKTRLIAAAKAAPKATSSCGSCFLGDAFRCASCPYLGLPAFQPGQKVEIDAGMDDI
ncbi:cytokine-induced anti-apoptosis inhibitor 1, Fe-S biogenesis-domain-containing protein [Rhizoctonia solani]|nr:cytokine-induced anti-apoptosis inhibitor 1, Fe-S biogenesis-domain-containing protein [Rhizoctonia solani]